MGTVRHTDQLSGRVEKSWAPSQTGLKLTAFQVRFFLSVDSWARAALPPDKVAAYDKLKRPRLMVRAMYNDLGGRPTPDMLRLFQTEAKEIERMTCFGEFFDKMDMRRSNLEIQTMLCNAMIDSKRIGYDKK